MKKDIKVISFILLLAVLLPSFVACGGKAEFNKLDDRGKAAYIIENTNSHYKNKLKQVGDFSYTIEGTADDVDIKMEVSGTSARAVSDADSDKMKFSNVTKMKVLTQTEKDSESEEYTETIAFGNGFMYMGYDTDKTDGTDVYLKSALSAKEFSDFLESSDIFPKDPNYAELCDNVTVTSAGLGSRYIIKITHGPDNPKEDLTRITNDLTSAFGIRFDLVSLDMEYTVDARNLLIKTIKVKYVSETPKFDNDQLRLTYESTLTVDNPGVSDLTVDNEKNYTETGDLRYAFYLSQKLNGLISAESAGYTVTSKSKVNADGTAMSNTEETDVINCGYKNDIYVYSIDAKANFYGQNIEMDIIYNGSQQKVKQKGTPAQTTATNEIVARMFLINILNTVLISPSEIKGIEVTDTSNDVITVEMDLVFGDRYVERLKSASLPIDLMYNKSVKMTVEYDKSMDAKSVILKLSTDYEYDGKNYHVSIFTIVGSFKNGNVSSIKPVKPNESEA